MDANTRIVQGLSKVVDEHIAWLSQWHQVAFYGGPERGARAAALVTPSAFVQWAERAERALESQVAILKRLGDLHDQLHTAAKLVLMKTPDGEALAIDDYEKVLTRFDEFITAVRRMERAFSEAAAGLDPLTGLRTRNGLQEDFNREMTRLKNAGTPFVLAMLDIDHFKVINDSHGHETGDRVLVATSNCLLRHIRTYDDAYRLGGEEFLVLFKGLDAVGAENVLERLRVALTRLEVKAPDGAAVTTSASFGFVGAASGNNLDALLQTVDAALYKAKRDGRNRVVKAA
jgi:diguanylate cyclase (GGDEF)-like protein